MPKRFDDVRQKIFAKANSKFLTKRFEISPSQVYLKSTFFRLFAKLRFFATTNRTLDAKKKIEQRANLVQREAESF